MLTFIVANLSVCLSHGLLLLLSSIFDDLIRWYLLRVESLSRGHHVDPAVLALGAFRDKHGLPLASVLLVATAATGVRRRIAAIVVR